MFPIRWVLLRAMQVRGSSCDFIRKLTSDHLAIGLNSALVMSMTVHLFDVLQNRTAPRRDLGLSATGLRWV